MWSLFIAVFNLQKAKETWADIMICSIQKQQNNSMVRLICMDLFNNLKFQYNMMQVIGNTDITLTF